MGEFIVFERGASLIGAVVWQSSLFLLAGLAGGLILARRPARAHRLLLLAIAGALFTPLCGQLVRRAGWGFWTTNPPDVDPPVASSTVSTASEAASPASGVQNRATDTSRHAMSSAEPLPAAIPASTAAASGSASARWGGEARSGLLDRLGFRAIAPIRFPNALAGLWCLASCLFVVRLVVSLVRGHHLAGRARPIACESIEHAAGTACERLGLRLRPELRISTDVDCPAIWCWGRRPVIVLPAAANTAAPVDWAGVFCHELAHWARRDQWSSLLGELLIAALPWHPLAWWARHRLGQLSELACDDWVLGTGLPAADYAESLLGLVPQRGASLALAAVSSRRGLFGRIQHILDERQSSPVVGKRWACASAVAVVLAASALALAQSRPAVSKGQRAQKDETEKVIASKTDPVSNQAATKTRTIRGTVLGPDGKPFSGATVFWVSHPKAALHPLAIPRDQKAKQSTRADVLGETRTDPNGRFSLVADFDPDRYYHQDGFNAVLLVKTPGMGMLAHFVKAGATEVTLRLAPEVVIRGRLLTPSGMPAAGVRVTLDDFFNDEMTEGMAVGMTPTDDLVPRYWPEPRTTNADGRFTLDGVPQGTYAHLDFWHPDYAVDQVTVDTTTAGGIAKVVKTYLKAFEIAPAKPTFTHTLEPARPVQGRVTDKQTGQPLAGMLVQLSTMGRHGGTPFHTRTDADGRYRVSGHQAQSYRTTVFPPADSEYLAGTDLQQTWPAGAKFLEKDFALDKGRIIRGQVIDAETKRPIAGAAVVYRPAGSNPNNRGKYDLSNTVLTDTEGRFAITTLPGQGIVAVQTPDETYMRVPSGALVAPQGVASIDVPNDGEAKPVEIAVRKGAILKAKVIGPNGNPVPEVAASCEGFAPMVMIYAWEPSAKGVFRLAGADPAKIYRVFFLQPDRQLGAVVDLKPDSDSKQLVEVTLQPMAKVHGKVVTDDGSPAEGAQVNVMIAMGRLKEGALTRSEILRDTTSYVELMGQKTILSYYMKLVRPKPKGEFVIDTLLPGTRFHIMAGAGRREALVSVPPLKPDEDRDLGTITLKERQP